MYIYMIKNKLNNKVYVGKTTRTITERMSEHYRGHKMPVDIDIQLYGKDNFEVVVLDQTDTIENLDRLERLYIEKYNAMNSEFGYNLCKGGSTTEGYKHRADSCAKMSQSRFGIFAGEKNPFYGKHHSDEQKAKWSEQRKGRKLTDEWKQHVSDNSPRKVPIICTTTGEHFNSLQEASIKYGIQSTHISRVCRGVRKSCKGLNFIYDNTVPSSLENNEKV